MSDHLIYTHTHRPIYIYMIAVVCVANLDTSTSWINNATRQAKGPSLAPALI